MLITYQRQNGFLWSLLFTTTFLEMYCKTKFEDSNKHCYAIQLQWKNWALKATNPLSFIISFYSPDEIKSNYISATLSKCFKCLGNDYYNSLSTQKTPAPLNYLLIIELIASVSLMKRNYWITFVTCVSTDNLFVQFTYSLTLFDLCVSVGPQLIWQLHNNSVGFKADAVSNDVHNDAEQRYIIRHR